MALKPPDLKFFMLFCVLTPYGSPRLGLRVDLRGVIGEFQILKCAMHLQHFTQRQILFHRTRGLCEFRFQRLRVFTQESATGTQHQNWITLDEPGRPAQSGKSVKTVWI